MRTIKFFSTVPGVAEAYPVIESREYRPQWVAGARENYLRAMAQANGDRISNLYRCPGIFDIMQTGYIIRSPWDIMIETKGDGSDFKWTIPSSDLPRIFNSPLVNGHMEADIAGSLPVRPNTLRSIVKFNLPWHVVAPPGVKLLVLPIPYPDTFEFEHSTGILDPGFSTEINAQLWWKVLKGNVLIKAGMPLMQLIPISEDKFNFEVSTATEKEIEWVKKKEYLHNLSFVMKRGLMKAMYLKHFFKR